MNTRNLNLPTWDEGNTEPDLVFNQALFVMDALLKSGVEGIESTPPGSPDPGQAWIVGDAATGAWAGHEDHIAIANTGGSGWFFVVPSEGWSIWVSDPGGVYQYLSSWEPTGSALTNPMTSTGDMIAGASGGSPVRVPSGTVGQAPRVQTDGSIAFQSDAAIGSAVTALSIVSGVVNINCALGDYFTLSLTAAVTSITFSNLPAAGFGRTLMVAIQQDATGSRTVALPSSFKAITGSDTAVQSAANARTLLAITTFDQGTRWEYSMKARAA